MTSEPNCVNASFGFVKSITMPSPTFATTPTRTSNVAFNPAVARSSISAPRSVCVKYAMREPNAVTNKPIPVAASATFVAFNPAISCRIPALDSTMREANPPVTLSSAPTTRCPVFPKLSTAFSDASRAASSFVVFASTSITTLFFLDIHPKEKEYHQPPTKHDKPVINQRRKNAVQSANPFLSARLF